MLIGFRKVLYRTLVFGVDGKNPKPSFHQTFHHRSPRRLNRYRHGFRVTAGNLLQPIQEIRDGSSAGFDDALGDYFSARIQHAHIVLLGCPIDSYKPTENHYHSPSAPTVRAASSPLYWHSIPLRGSAQTPHGTCHTNPDRGAGPGQALG